MALFLRNVVSNPIMKSLVISSHFHFGTFSGCSKPEGLYCSAFDLLAYHALGDKGNDIFLHVLPPILALHVLVHLCVPWVDGELRLKCLRHLPLGDQSYQQWQVYLCSKQSPRDLYSTYLAVHHSIIYSIYPLTLHLATEFLWHDGWDLGWRWRCRLRQHSHLHNTASYSPRQWWLFFQPSKSKLARIPRGFQLSASAITLTFSRC